MSGLFSYLIMLFVFISVVNSLRKRAAGRQKQPPAARSRREEEAAGPRVNSVGDDARLDRPAQRVNSAGEDARPDRSARRVNPVGDAARPDRAEQRRNSVGETPPRSRHQRMVEEQRQRAEAYRRQALGDRGPQPAPAPPETASRRRSDTCAYCGRRLKPGQQFCPACGRTVRPAQADAAAPAAFSYSDGDRPETSPAPVLAPRTAPLALALPAFTGPELACSLIMAEVLGPCKARQPRS